MMKQRHFIIAMFAAAALLLGMTGCTKSDNPVNDNPSPIELSAMEQELVGLWWDEYEYADMTEDSIPFTRVLLAVEANADHTGCLYLGVFDDTSDEPLVIYGGPADAGFTWKLLSDGRILLGDPVTGETYALARTRGDGDGDGSYGQDMTNVGSTTMTYTDGSMTVTNGDYSGTLYKAGADQVTEIQEVLTISAASADGTRGTYTDSKGQSREGIVVTLNGKKYAIATTNETENATVTVNDIAYYIWHDACKYFAGGKTDGSYDVANVWRMATETEMTALSKLRSRGYEKKDWNRKTIAGYRTWTIGSASLTLPCDGGYYESEGGAYNVNRSGYYWASTPHGSIYASSLRIESDNFWGISGEMNGYGNVLGYSVRLFCLLPTD